MNFNDTHKLKINDIEQVKSESKVRRLLMKTLTFGGLLIVFVTLFVIILPDGKFLYNEGNHRISNKI